MTSYVTIDPTTDHNGTVLNQISKRYQLPEFVKQAEMENTLRPTDLASSSYAWPQQKQFPCHSSAATWLSAAYFHDKVASFKSTDRVEIEKRLENFADYFGIRPAYDDLKKTAAQLNRKEEASDDCYAFVYVNENGDKERFYPLADAAGVKAATDWLRSNRERIPYTQRNEIGSKILERVNKIGVKLAADERDFLEKQSGEGTPDKDKLVSAIMTRSRLTDDAGQRESMQKLAQVVQTTPNLIMQRPQLVKLAESLDVFDTANNLIGKYTDIIPRPEDIVFYYTPAKRAAAEGERVMLTNGSVYSREDLEKISYDDLREVLGDDFAAEVSQGFRVDTEKLAEIAATLPASDAGLLDTILKSAGRLPRAYTQTNYGWA